VLLQFGNTDSGVGGQREEGKASGSGCTLPLGGSVEDGKDVYMSQESGGTQPLAGSAREGQNKDHDGELDTLGTAREAEWKDRSLRVQGQWPGGSGKGVTQDRADTADNPEEQQNGSGLLGPGNAGDGILHPRQCGDQRKGWRI